MQHKWIRNRIIVRQWIADCRTFFDNTTESSSKRNWEILHPMSLAYLSYLSVYLFAVCPVLDIAIQTSAVRAFTTVQALFTLCIFIRGNTAPSPRIVDLVITLFAAQILGLSGFLGIVVFPSEASFLFPLCIVLMTQIYTRRPLYPILEISLPSAVYLILCALTKDTYTFYLDAVSVSVALCITGAALFTGISYKMRAYTAQQALQKMCALDPMTGVNNKSTFEFLASDFLRSHPGTGCAIAICDLDNFKNINDTHGHLAGDDVLRAFSERLHLLVDGNPDLIAGRFGGDEFVIFFRHYDVQEDVLKQLEILGSVPGFDFPVTCSTGIAFSPSGDAGFQQLFDAADHSLYRSKIRKNGDICTADTDSMLL